VGREEKRREEERRGEERRGEGLCVGGDALLRLTHLTSLGMRLVLSLT
jgi:hypothetical protein